MLLIISAIVVLFITMVFLIWLLTKLKTETQEFSTLFNQQEKQILVQEQHLKQTLQIMQDLAKKMHVQQEVLDQTTQRMAQVELQNAELVRLLQQNMINQ